MADHAPTCPALEGGACACPWSAPVTTAVELRALVEAAPDWASDITLDCAGDAEHGLLWVATLQLATRAEPADADPAHADDFVALIARFDRPTLLRLVALWEAAETLEATFRAAQDVLGLTRAIGGVRNALAALRGDEGT